MADVAYYTKEGLEKLKEELQYLKTTVRANISKAIAEARDKGDLSENAEYDAAKEAQGMLEAKIKHLESVIALAQILDEKNIDTITGYIHQLDLFKNPATVKEVLLPIPTVPESMSATDLMNKFSKERKSIAWVIDEFGGTAGIVTMEDILEEITGDIKDEFDDEESGDSKIDDYNYIFEGRTMINDVCKLMDLPVDTFERVRGDSDSLAGLILEIAGHFPAVNDTVSSGDFDFTILELDRNRIKKVKIAVKPVIKE